MTMLSERQKISQAITLPAGVSGTTDVNGTTLDMSGYDGVLMVVQFGTIAIGAVTSIKAQQGQQSDGSDMADLAGTGQTVADTDDDKVFMIDLFRPKERFVRIVIDRGTAGASCAAMYYQYQARSQPPTHGANVAVERHIGPAEGAV